MSGQSPIHQLLSKATALYHAGEYRQAVQAWEEILQIEPSNQRAKEGIRMASLLLEEAQAAADAAASKPDPAVVETPEITARVRQGIEQVRAFLAESRHLEAIEVCRSLLALAPRSAAVREILEEAREAYEAQPFIAEHLEIARQLFVQERLDEAALECQKVFFLNPNHAEAQRLHAKIQTLKRKLTPAATESSPGGSPPPQEEAASPPPGEAATPPAPPAPTPSPSLPVSKPILNENWEEELAQVSLGPETPTKEGAGSPSGEEQVSEPIPLMDLSEDPVPPPRVAAVKESDHELTKDLPRIETESASEREPAAATVRESPQFEAAARWTRTHREEPIRASSPMKWLLPLMAILAGGWLAFWYFGLRPSETAGGSSSSRPPRFQTPRHPGPGGATGTGGGNANLGLSSSGSRGDGAATKAGIETGSGAAAAGRSESLREPEPTLTPDQARREISRLSAEGRRLMQKGNYPEAVETFAKVLELDPANLEIKDQMDQAAGKVLEQKRLEEDVQTGKELFLDKDFESALRKFYRLPRDRNLGNLDLFIRNAWYNWGVVSLKGGNCVDALQRLQEALSVDPNDSEARKQQEVAERYKDRTKDRAFYAYVDRLSLRTLDQK